jgi:hypothetical protein
MYQIDHTGRWSNGDREHWCTAPVVRNLWQPNNCGGTWSHFELVPLHEIEDAIQSAQNRAILGQSRRRINMSNSGISVIQRREQNLAVMSATSVTSPG